MAAHINFFPLGNADTLRLDLADGRKVLVDFAAMCNQSDEDDKRCDLPNLLKQDLRKTNRNDFDAVCITHTDTDHCKGFGDFFWLEHATKYQDEDRVKIKELWVPAAAILEVGLKDDARLVREEARYRLREGKDVLVFSHPDALKEWFKDEGIDFEKRKHLIIDAGNFVPGYSKEGKEKVEFFVHSPFGWRQDENSQISRNDDSIVLHATFVEKGRETRLLMASDITHETITDIVKVTRKHDNEDRLRWDIMKLMHHCSYLSLGPERGEKETEPVSEVKWLFENQREDNSIIVSSSEPIPQKHSEEDKSDQPPHRQAANYHRRISDEQNGQFLVTMEYPSKANPKPLIYKAAERGIAPVLAAPIISTSTTAAASTPRAG